MSVNGWSLFTRVGLPDDSTAHYTATVKTAPQQSIAIVADDFTSATDGLACFAARGWRCAVVHDAKRLPRRADVVSIDTQSRTLPADSARERIRSLASALAGVPLIVKQFDSTLRGNVAPECHAALRVSGRDTLVVIPAFPSAGRTTVNAIQLLHGRPVHLTDCANDPLNPVRTSSLLELFSAVSASVRCVANAREALRALRSHEVVLVDATSEEQLDDIVSTLRDEAGVVWAGSTGLLRAIARAQAPIHRRRQPTCPRAARPLIVVGSASPVSRVQLRSFAVGGGQVVVLDPEQCSAAEAVARVMSSRGGESCAITTTERRIDPAHSAKLLATVAARLISGRHHDGLVVTGGDTAFEVTQALHADSIEVLCELEAGVPKCTLRTAARRIPMITKAGAFGSGSVLTDAVKLLSRPSVLR